MKQGLRRLTKRDANRSSRNVTRHSYVGGSSGRETERCNVTSNQNLEHPDDIKNWFENPAHKYNFFYGLGSILSNKEKTMTGSINSIKLELDKINDEYNKNEDNYRKIVEDTQRTAPTEMKEALQETIREKLNVAYESKFSSLINKKQSYDLVKDSIVNRRWYIVDSLQADVGKAIIDRIQKAAESIYFLYRGKKYTEIRKKLYGMIITIATAPESFQKSFSLNTSIVGPAGSGKTTMAKEIAKWYAKLGLLTYDAFFEDPDKLSLSETARTDFIGEYTGQTGPKTLGVLIKSLEKTLFIDEAYSVAGCAFDKDDKLEPDSYGEEFLATLLTFMNDHRGFNALIVAGYENLMKKCFMARNEGLPRRFPNQINLPFYTTDELFGIFLGTVMSKSLFATDSRIKKLDSDNTKLEKEKDALEANIAITEAKITAAKDEATKKPIQSELDVLKENKNKMEETLKANKDELATLKIKMPNEMVYKSRYLSVIKPSFMLIHNDTAHSAIEILRKYLLIFQVRINLASSGKDKCLIGDLMPAAKATRGGAAPLRLTNVATNEEREELKEAQAARAAAEMTQAFENAKSANLDRLLTQKPARGSNAETKALFKREHTKALAEALSEIGEPKMLNYMPAESRAIHSQMEAAAALRARKARRVTTATVGTDSESDEGLTTDELKERKAKYEARHQKAAKPPIHQTEGDEKEEDKDISLDTIYSYTILSQVLTNLLSDDQVNVRKQVFRRLFYKAVFNFEGSNMSYFPAQAGEMENLADECSRTLATNIPADYSKAAADICEEESLINSYCLGKKICVNLFVKLNASELTQAETEDEDLPSTIADLKTKIAATEDIKEKIRIWHKLKEMESLSETKLNSSTVLKHNKGKYFVELSSTNFKITELQKRISDFLELGKLFNNGIPSLGQLYLDLFNNTKRDAYTAHVVDLYLRKANYEYLEDILFMTEKEYPIHISKEQLEAEMEVLKPFRNLTKLEYLMSHEEKLPEELNTKIRNMNDPIPLDNIRTDYSLLEQEIKNKTNAAAKATGQDRQRLTSELKQLVSDRVKVYKKMEKEAEFEKALNTGEKIDKQFNELYKSYPQETKEAIYLALIKKKQIIRDLQNENALTVAGRTPNLQHPKMSVITSDLPQNPDKVKVYREDVLYEDFGYNKTLRPI